MTTPTPAGAPARRSKQRLGREGEQCAVEHLRRQGLAVLDRNWHCREGELDIVATDGRVLVVCEVKTRSGERYGSGAAAITEEKIVRIRRLALRWLSAHRVTWCPIRFDVISILYPPGRAPKVRHIQGAF